MTGKLILIFVLFLFKATAAQGMLRVLKYKPMTTVSGNKICMFAKHEHNPKKENANNPLNIEKPLACNMTLVAKSEANAKIMTKSVLNTFPYGKLTKTCADFPSAKTSKLSFEGVETECALLSSAPRVFSHWPKSPLKKGH